MRYYHYLSAAKVEMLHAQLGHKRSAGKTEVGFDFKYFKGTRGTERSGDVSIYDKLAAVEEYIYANEPCGTVDAPAPWILDRVDLKAVIFWRPNPPLDGVWQDPPIDSAVLYAGETESGNMLIMGGSVRHLVGSAAITDPPKRQVGVSEATTFWDFLGELTASTQNGVQVIQADPNDLMTAQIVTATSPGAVALGSCEILAKRFTLPRSPSTKYHWVAGSPLFVSLVD